VGLGANHGHAGGSERFLHPGKTGQPIPALPLPYPLLWGLSSARRSTPRHSSRGGPSLAMSLRRRSPSAGPGRQRVPLGGQGARSRGAGAKKGFRNSDRLRLSKSTE
jgi:hypothetical protein